MKLEWIERGPLSQFVDEDTGATVIYGTGPGGFATIENGIPTKMGHDPRSDWLVGYLTGFLTRDATSDDHLLAKLDFYFSLRQYLEATGDVLEEEWDGVARAALERAAAWRRDRVPGTNKRESWGPPTPRDAPHWKKVWADCGLAAVGDNKEREEK